MKKIILAVATACCAMFANAQTTEPVMQELSPSGKKFYEDCMVFSSKVGELFTNDLKNEYEKNCASVSFSWDNAEATKKYIIENIVKKDFEATKLVASNEADYMLKLGLITSFLIESPEEKKELVEYFNGSGKEQSPEEQQKVIEELDIKYKRFKIDNVLYKNLLKANKVLKQDAGRMESIQKASSEKIVSLLEEFKKTIGEDKEKLERTDSFIQVIKDGDQEFLRASSGYLNNLSKYLKTQDKANLVYRVFNSKNPLFVDKETMPNYSKSECEVLKDWELDVLAKEKHQIDTIKGCK